jgi:hypothetical protein
MHSPADRLVADIILSTETDGISWSDCSIARFEYGYSKP